MGACAIVALATVNTAATMPMANVGAGPGAPTANEITPVQWRGRHWRGGYGPRYRYWGPRRYGYGYYPYYRPYYGPHLYVGPGGFGFGW